MKSQPAGLPRSPQPAATEPERELGLFTGKPAFAEPLHVGRPNIGDRARLHERLDETSIGVG
ncbi:MAG: hypothetical protein R3F17_12580 [Planctomycetota bacterium]